MVSKVFEKFVKNGIVDLLEKCGLFLYFQYGFRSSRSTADLLTVVSDRIAGAFNRSGATRDVELDISKVTGLGMLVFFVNLGLMEFQVRYLASFLLFSVIGGFKWFWMGSLHEIIPQGFILGPTRFLLYINVLPDDIMCNIAIYAADSTLYSKCHKASDLWQQLELASKLESDL